MYEAMINERNVKCFCNESPNLIENYDKAISDNNKVWDCHHRLEIELNKSRQELKNLKLYWHRPASELIFLTHSEHLSVHKKNKSLSLIHKQKLSKAVCGELNGMYGKHHSEEARQKMREAKLGKKRGPYKKRIKNT